MVYAPSQLSYTRTQRGRRMLVHDGFKYVINRESQKNIFWRCNRYVRHECRAGAVTSKTIETIRLTHSHSHSREKFTSDELMKAESSSKDESNLKDELFEIHGFN